MKRLIPVLLSATSIYAASLPMDSARGDKLFVSQGCSQCHRLKGQGGTMASDLSRVLDRGYLPTDLVGAMWNHAPVMWAAIDKQGTQSLQKMASGLDEQAATDLFASFLSARYFEIPGDAGRGKMLFESRLCASCHGLTTSPNPKATPVANWQTLSDPAGMVGAMWNHSPDMWSELAKRKQKWPAMTAQDLSDVLVYLRHSNPSKSESGFRISESANGAKLFESKGCIACHKSGMSSARNTITGVAAAMWNHASFLHAEPPRIDAGEMRDLLGYYWATNYFEVQGNAARGRRLLTNKRCPTCHSGAGPGPLLAAKAGSFSAISMVSALWLHGPTMLRDMQQRKIPWPMFKAGEMEDLLAALNEPKSANEPKPKK